MLLLTAVSSHAMLSTWGSLSNAPPSVAVMTDWALNNFGDISKDWRVNPDIRVDPKGVAMVSITPHSL